MMAELTVQEISRDGLEATYAAAAVGLADEFNNDGKTFFHVKNGATDCVITIDIPNLSIDGQAVTDITITCTATEERMIGPFPPGWYNDGDGHVNVAYDDVSNVTVAAIRLP
jgi:hypothetical protein